MGKVVAAIYRPGNQDRFMHASMSCARGQTGNIDLRVTAIRITEAYRVNTVHTVINKGKTPCPECWSNKGYDALNDLVAERAERG